MGLLAAFGPIWILSVTGYLARRYHVLAENGAVVLGQFLFQIAIPAALFTTLAKTPLSGFALRPLAAFRGEHRDRDRRWLVLCWPLVRPQARRARDLGDGRRLRQFG